MPRAFTEEEKEQIKAALVEAGGELFAAHGLRRTNVEELAKRAGISKGAFYLFYESKEALFMDVAEEAEGQFRQEVLAMVDEPGPTPRARLAAVLRRANRLWREIPVLQFFTQSEYTRLSRKIPVEVFKEHQRADYQFFDTLIAHCREEGIDVKVEAEDFYGLMYVLFLTGMHEDDPLPIVAAGIMEQLIELAAAYFLGEIELEAAGLPAKTTENR